MNLNCWREDFHSTGLQRISSITSRVNMSRRVLNSFCVPAVSSSFQRNGQKFQPEALLKRNRWVLPGWLVCMSLRASLCFKTRTFKAKIGEGHRWTITAFPTRRTFFVLRTFWERHGKDPHFWEGCLFPVKLLIFCFRNGVEQLLGGCGLRFCWTAVTTQMIHNFWVLSVKTSDSTKD